MRFLKENYEGLPEVDGLPEYLKRLLSDFKIQEALRKSDFNTLYRELQEKVPYSGVGEFTQLLVNLNIDPLNYLDYIPNSFLTSTSIKKINIPDHITSIGEFAFAHCGSLTSITIPNNVTSISSYVFTHCEKLKSITIPDKITKINSSTFYYCTSLTSITIPDSVTSIGDSVFSGCDNLTRVTIPDSVTSISFEVFSDCEKLKEITYKGMKENWNKIKKHPAWNSASAIKTIRCVDGDIEL